MKEKIFCLVLFFTISISNVFYAQSLGIGAFNFNENETCGNSSAIIGFYVNDNTTSNDIKIQLTTTSMVNLNTAVWSLTETNSNTNVNFLVTSVNISSNTITFTLSNNLNSWAATGAYDLNFHAKNVNYGTQTL